MCGIAGFIASDSSVSEAHIDSIRKMTSRMSLRGPDAEDMWVGEGVIFGHRRLSILDLDPRSNQPMASFDQRYRIVFNGEIYNFRELRRDLEAQGVSFRTTSDTEVLLALFARCGIRMLPLLRGMFAFAIWDTHTRELFLARDPYGIKPLYYADTKDGFLFASQVKALLVSGLVARDIEPAGLAGFYLWGSVPEPWTIFRNVRALPAGSWMRVRSGKTEGPVIWQDIREEWRLPNRSLPHAELQKLVQQAVTDSVRAHLVSDVPVSVLLSGGIDSGTIAALASQLGSKVEGITVGFDEFSASQHDEIPGASTIASHYGLPHSIYRVSRSKFEQELPHFFEHMDQPTIDGLNTWLASKAVAERGYKVVLSGVGGDELFYGYSLVYDVPRRARLGQFVTAVPGTRPLLKAAFKKLPGDRWHPKFRGIPEFMGSIEGEYFLRRGLFLPQELPMLMDPAQATEGLARLGGTAPGVNGTDAVNQEGAVCVLDSTLYLRNQLLRDSDWASMAHSLELRTPLVDAKLLSATQSIHTHFAGGEGKRLLSQSPATPLPEKIVNRPKSGFDVPMTRWLSSAFQGFDWSKSPVLASARTPWSRRWASVVITRYLESCVSPLVHQNGSSGDLHAETDRQKSA